MEMKAKLVMKKSINNIYYLYVGGWQFRKSSSDYFRIDEYGIWKPLKSYKSIRLLSKLKNIRSEIVRLNR